LRMLAAYNAGSYQIAERDAGQLLGSGALPDNEIRLVRARILVDTSQEGDNTNIDEALGLLNNIGNNISEELLAVANEYRARAHLRRRSFGDALNAVDRALANTETGSRHYLRGQILEGLGRNDDAIEEYQWVLSWSNVYPYPYAPDAREHLEALGGA
jgi:tetratricopeptide (TPR) repeat protein